MAIGVIWWISKMPKCIQFKLQNIWRTIFNRSMQGRASYRLDHDETKNVTISGSYCLKMIYVQKKSQSYHIPTISSGNEIKKWLMRQPPKTLSLFKSDKVR